DGTGNGPLNSACLHGDLEMVRLLLNHGARINHHGDKGDTPLHDAVANEHEDVVRILLASGANPMIKNKGGETSIDVCDSR
ncbi:ankyrin, partial [Saitoella complicata NRRL Y-17804]